MFGSCVVIFGWGIPVGLKPEERVGGKTHTRDVRACEERGRAHRAGNGPQARRCRMKRGLTACAGWAAFAGVLWMWSAGEKPEAQLGAASIGTEVLAG